jgi:hypothetical protein
VENEVHIVGILMGSDAISIVLAELSVGSTDSVTVTNVQGLLKRLDFGVIVSLDTLEQVLQITGPCPKILQSTSADIVLIAVAAQLICQCRQKLEKIKLDENLW